MNIEEHLSGERPTMPVVSSAAVNAWVVSQMMHRYEPSALVKCIEALERFSQYAPRPNQNMVLTDIEE
jgi:hypothetical protein